MTHKPTPERTPVGELESQIVALWSVRTWKLKAACRFRSPLQGRSNFRPPPPSPPHQGQGTVPCSNSRHGCRGALLYRKARTRARTFRIFVKLAFPVLEDVDEALGLSGADTVHPKGASTKLRSTRQNHKECFLYRNPGSCVLWPVDPH